jgi:uncharacterized protein (DUF1778 family)
MHYTELMARNATKTEHPLSMRLPAGDVEIIDRAARVRGRSRTEFVRDAAVRAAEDVLMERTIVRMSPEGFSAFAKAIAGSGRAVNALVKVLKRKAPWE